MCAEIQEIQRIQQIQTSEKFKEILKKYRNINENTNEIDYLENFYVLIIGCYCPEERLINLIQSIPNYAKKLEKFLKIYDLLFKFHFNHGYHFENIIKYYLEDINIKSIDFINSYCELSKTFLIILIDKIANNYKFLKHNINKFDDFINMISINIIEDIKKIRKNFKLNELISNIENIKPLLEDLKNNKLNHYYRIILKYYINNLINNFYIFAAYKKINVNNSILIKRFIWLAAEAELITEQQEEHLINFINICSFNITNEKINNRKKHKVLSFCLAGLYGLNYNYIYHSIYW